MSRRSVGASGVQPTQSDIRSFVERLMAERKPMPPLRTLGGSISIWASEVTGRTLEEYEGVMGVQRKYLAGNRVLDIGSGYGLFLKACVAENIDVVGLDPGYSERGRQMLHVDTLTTAEGRLKFAAVNLRKAGAQIVAGFHQALPFSDSSFNVVLGSYSSIAYLTPNYQDHAERKLAARRMVEETIRVLKPGGWARFTVSANSIYLSEQEALLNDVLEDVSKRQKISWKFTDVKGIASDQFMASIRSDQGRGVLPSLINGMEYVLVLKKEVDWSFLIRADS